MKVSQLIDSLKNINPDFDVFVDVYDSKDKTFSIRKSFRITEEDVRLNSFEKVCRIGVVN